MGVDCIFVAENRNKVTIADFEADALSGKFPGGSGRFIKSCYVDYDLEQPLYAYCYIGFVNDLVAVHDGCRYGSDRDSYQKPMLAYLQEKCGGRAGVWTDICDPIGDCDFDTSEKITKAFDFNGGNWPQPKDEPT